MPSLLEKIRSTPRSLESTGEPTKSGPDYKHSAAKVYSLIGLNTALALGVGFLFSRQEFGYGMLLLVLFISFTTVQCLSLKYPKEDLIAATLCSLGLMIPFIGSPYLYHLATLVLIWLLLFHAHSQGRRYIDNMVKIKFARAARPIIGALLTTVVLLMTFVLFVSGASVLRQENIGRALDILVTPIAQGYIEGFSSSAVFGDVLQSMAREQINQSPEAVALGDAQIDFLAMQSAREMAQYIEDQTGFTPLLNETVTSNVQAFITDKADNFAGTRAPIGLAVLFGILLLLVKGLELILFVPLALLAYMLYELAIAFGFITVQFESRSKEVINLA